MDQNVEIDCYNCKILYPGMAKCGVCEGTGRRFQRANLGDDRVSHEILRDALDRRDLKEGTILSGRSSLVRTLVLWQLHGASYVFIERRFRPGTPEHEREVKRIGDQIVTLIRKMDRM